MTKRAHIRWSEAEQVFKVLGTYNSEKGRITLADGSVTSPLIIGFISGDDRIVEVFTVVNDTSTGDRTIVTTIGEVTGTAVTHTTNVRDMTQQEMDDADEAELEEDVADVVVDMLGKSLYKIVNEIQALKGANPLTPTQFRNWLKNNARS